MSTARSNNVLDQAKETPESSSSRLVSEILQEYNPDDFPEEIVIESSKQSSNQNSGQSFEASEHSDIGNYSVVEFMESIKNNNQAKDFEEALLSFLKVSDNPNKIKIFDPQKGEAIDMPIYEIDLAEEIKITVGEIVALAGDFFGIADKPISFGEGTTEAEREADCNIRFEQAYSLLFNLDSGTQKIVKKVVAHMREEAESSHSHFSFSMKFIKKKINDATSNIRYGLEMAEGKSLTEFWHSPYFNLSLTNFDHFGNEAQVAYLTGHKLAIAKAKLAGSKSGDERKKLLKEALLREMFACHFLTDLFASGHIRTIRKEILNHLLGQPLSQNPNLKAVSSVNLAVAGFFAKAMHDEDSRGNIFVKIKKDAATGNEVNKSIRASGDGNFFKKVNKDYANIICQTVILALKDLFLAYQQKETVLDKELSSYIPKEDVEQNRTKRKPPLFYKKGESVNCRGNLTNEGISCIGTHIGLISSRFFNVKLKPAVSGAAREAEAEKVTKEKIDELYSGLGKHNIPCSIL